MTDVKDLFLGVGVIIDEAIYEKAESLNGIQKIVKSLEKKNIPILKYIELPDSNLLKHFNSINFIILDWNLSGISPIPEATIMDNINFIKGLQKYCFVPIFIFSDESPNDIILKIDEANLNTKNIFIKQKFSLNTSRQLFSVISKWIRDTPSIYVLKIMETSLYRSKNDLFWDFQNIDSNWVNILQKTITSDGADPNIDLLNILYKNLIARSSYTDFKIPNKRIKDKNLKNDIRKVLEHERFLTTNLPNKPCCGDIFKITNNGNTSYFLNIRPDCDTIRGNNDTELYCLKGRIVDETKINGKSKTKIKFEKGNFLSKISNIYVPFIDNGLIIEFKFNDLILKKWGNIKDDRIGRLLPPYITRIQQNYGLYSLRQGLPAIPKEAIL
jgi:hypothetical protein